MISAQPDATAVGRIARVIFDHASQISKEKDLGALICLNANLARDLTGAERCSLWLLDAEKSELWTKVAHGVEGELRIPSSKGIVGACVAEDRPLIVNNLRSDERFLGTVDDSTGYRTECILCVPIRVDHKVIGVLQALNKVGGFTTEDADLLGLMSVYAGTAIQTERLRQHAEAGRILARELDIAREVQNRLLPRDVKTPPGIEFAGFCRPARSIGGDYYDAMELPGGAFGLSLGDVSGKGVAAALLMASIQSLLRSLLMRDSSHLAENVVDLNRALYQSSSAERYSTLFCAVLNGAGSHMTFVNAGHIPAIIVRVDGTIERPAIGDLPIGLLPLIHYEQHTVEMQPGDIVVCISDGMLDVELADGKSWEDADMELVLRDNRSLPVEEIVRSLFSAVDACSVPGEQFDDMTAIAVRLLDR